MNIRVCNIPILVINNYIDTIIESGWYNNINEKEEKEEIIKEKEEVFYEANETVEVVENKNNDAKKQNWGELEEEEENNESNKEKENVDDDGFTFITKNKGRQKSFKETYDNINNKGSNN